MRTHTKKPPTEVSILGDKREIFLVHPKDLPKVRQVLKKVAVQGSDGVPWREAFKDLTNKYSETGSVIRGFRARDDMTQSELAARLGTTPQVVSLLESGKRPISLGMAKRLAKVFETDHRVFL